MKERKNKINKEEREDGKKEEERELYIEQKKE
jgi:hypothetical protein